MNLNMKLLIIALAPVFIIAVYVYYRDKYEREPLGMLLKALLLGVLIPLPVIVLERFLSGIKPDFPGAWPAFYDAFIVAAFSEELFKLLALYLLVWKSSHFNEKFDGIVYAVFISLGFAGVENILYVFQHGRNDRLYAGPGLGSRSRFIWSYHGILFRSGKVFIQTAEGSSS
jgi:RsiW-degrading membrane proteinase PrsW (M82 family)